MTLVLYKSTHNELSHGIESTFHSAKTELPSHQYYVKLSVYVFGHVSRPKNTTLKSAERPEKLESNYTWNQKQ